MDKDKTEEVTPSAVQTAKDNPLYGKGRPPQAVGEQIQKEKQLAMLEKKKNGVIKKKSRMDVFLAEFLKNGGNATKAAQKAYPNASHSSAATIGGDMLREARMLGRIVLEEKGYSYGRLLEIAAQKAENSKSPDWWDRVMKIADYEDFLSKPKDIPQQVINIVNAQKDLMSEYVDGEVMEEEDED